MRLRFSLRTFFVLVTLLAAFCYYWFVLPTVVAKRFVQAITVRDYTAADHFFSDPVHRFIAGSADKYWAFNSHAQLLPLTIHQLLTGQRSLTLQFDYFHLDQTVASVADLRASPFGLQAPVISRAYSQVFIDGAESFETHRIR